MRKYIDFIHRFRKALMVLFIILMILAIAGVRQLDINADFDIFKLNASEHQNTLLEMNEIFGDNTQTLLMIASSLDTYEEDIRYTEKILKNLDTSYVSPYTILNQLEGSLEEKTKLLDSLSPIIIKDEQVYITFSLNVSSDYNFRLLSQSLDREHYIVGDAYMQSELISLILSIIMFIPPIALFLVLLTFRSQLGSTKAALLSVLPAGIAALWTMGLAGWFGGEVSIVTVLAPIFSIVIGSADGLHFISHLEDYEGERLEGLSHTLSLVGMPMVITTTTSIAGFIGLMFIDTNAIQSLAIFASVGIFLAGLVTWYVLPLILVGGTPLKRKSTIYRLSNIKNLWGKKSVVLVLIMLLIASIFIPRITTEFNQLMFFKDSTDVQKNFTKILEVNEGALPIYYMGSTTLEEAETTLGHIQTFISQLETSEAVGKVINPTRMIDKFEFNLSNLSKVSQFIRLKNTEIYFRIVVFPKDLNNDTLDTISQIKSENLEGSFTGVQFLMKEMNESLLSGQFKSILATLILIWIMLILALRSLKLTAIASFPIVLTSVVLYGFLGLSGISLNVFTATIFSITLGIGVDYAIHYVSIYKYYLDHNHDNAREQALIYTMRPIVANALGLSLGMTALWISPLRVHFHVSSMMWIAMMTSVILSLTLIPTLLKKNN